MLQCSSTAVKGIQIVSIATMFGYFIHVHILYAQQNYISKWKEVFTVVLKGLSHNIFRVLFDIAGQIEAKRRIAAD